MELIGQKLTRKDLEVQLGLTSKEATAAIRKMVRGGLLTTQMDHVEPTVSAKRERRYAFVAQTSDLFSVN